MKEYSLNLLTAVAAVTTPIEFNCDYWEKYIFLKKIKLKFSISSFSYHENIKKEAQ